MKPFSPKQFNSERQSEGITLITVALVVLIMGVTALNLPAWTALIFIPLGIILYIIGLDLYKQA